MLLPVQILPAAEQTQVTVGLCRVGEGVRGAFPCSWIYPGCPWDMSSYQGHQSADQWDKGSIPHCWNHQGAPGYFQALHICFPHPQSSAGVECPCVNVNPIHLIVTVEICLYLHMQLCCFICILWIHLSTTRKKMN